MPQWQPAITAAGNGFLVTWTAEEYNYGYNTGRNVMGRLFDANGYKTGKPFTAALKLNPDKSVATSSWERDASLATLKDGRIVMAYHFEGDIALKVFSSAGVQQSVKTKINVKSAGYEIEPKVAALKDGGYVVVWQDKGGHDGSHYGVFGRAFNANGTARGGDFVINRSTYASQTEPEVTALAGGGFVVTWKTNYDAGLASGRDYTLARVFNANGTARTGEFEIRSDKNFAYGYDGAEMVALPDGGFLALYTVNKAKTGNIYSDSDSDCYVRRFDASGKAVGAEFRVNPGDPDINNGHQVEIHGASLGNGRVALAWVDEAAGRVVRRVIEVSTLNGDGTKGNDFITLTGNAAKVRHLGAGDDALVGSAGADTVHGGTGKDTITGGAGKDRLYGDAGDDKLGGNDTLRGGSGKDRLYGGTGDDVLHGGTGGDLLDGGSGKDTASYEGATRKVVASLKSSSKNTGDAKGDTYKSIENLTGSKYGDQLTGNDKANGLQDGAGNDKLFGLGDNDRLSGGKGNDVLTGGKGADTLVGGTGKDTFVFKALSDSMKATGRDTIADFSRREKDRIDLSDIDAIAGTKKNDGFDFIGKEAFSKTAGELRFAKSQGDTFIYGDVNGDGKADFSIRIDAGINLLESDFIL